MMKKTLLIVSLLMLVACGQNETTGISVAESAKKSVVVETESVSSSLSNIENAKEKLDFFKLIKVFQNSEVEKAQAKELEWNQRLVEAKNNADVQSIVAEQLVFYRKARDGFADLKLETAEGQAVLLNLQQGFSGMCSILEKLQKIDVSQPEGMVLSNELVPKIKVATYKIIEGMQMWTQMGKKYGVPIDKQAEEKFNNKIKEVKGKF